MISLRIGFIAVLFAAAVAAAETHWVTTAEEFNALPVLNAGDRVVLQDGTYGALDTTLVSSIADDATAQTNPVLIYAQSPGGVQVLLPSAISLEGSGIVLAGLDFGAGSGMIDNGSTDPAAIIRTEPDSRYITLSNLRFKNCTAGDDYGSWLSICGFNHTIEYCSFEGKDDPVANATVVFRRNLDEAGPTVPRNHVLRRCYFGPRQVSATDNGYETIRIGDSGSQIYQLSVTIEENVFYRSIWRDDGESGNDTEIISNKSAGNIIRNNTFLESFGQITLRHGDYVTVEGNWIFGGGAYANGGIEIVSTNVHQSGVRVIGQDHIVRNNYFKNLRGIGLRAALCVMAGFSDFDDGDGTTGDNRYEAAHNAQILGNRFADCRQISLGYVKDSADEQPSGVAMISNIWQSTDSDDAIVRSSEFEIGTSASNIIYESGGDFGWTGLTDSTYTTSAFPDIGNFEDEIPSIGSAPLLRDEVGPLFDGGPSNTYPVAIGGLDPNVPPSGNFDLTQWYLQLPVDATNGFDGEARIVEAPELSAGFELEPWFYTATNGTLAFSVPWNGALKGTSISPRSELRETYSDGELRNWTPLEDGGVHTLRAVCTVTSVGDGKVAIGQIHGKEPDVPTVILRYDNTVDPAQMAVSVYNTPDGLSGKTWLVYDAPAFGEEIAYQMDVVAVSNAVSFFCTINGETQSVALTNDVSAWLDATFYYKAGAYYTVAASGETARVFFSELELTRGEGVQVATAALPNGVIAVPYFQTLEKNGWRRSRLVASKRHAAGRAFARCQRSRFRYAADPSGGSVPGLCAKRIVCGFSGFELGGGCLSLSRAGRAQCIGGFCQRG